MKQFLENYREVRVKGQRFSPESEAKMGGAKIERSFTDLLQMKGEERLEFEIKNAAFLDRLEVISKLESPNLLRIEPDLISLVNEDDEWMPLLHEDIWNVRKMIVDTIRSCDEDFVEDIVIATTFAEG
jgi:hypothetical protein